MSERSQDERAWGQVVEQTVKTAEVSSQIYCATLVSLIMNLSHRDVAHEDSLSDDRLLSSDVVPVLHADSEKVFYLAEGEVPISNRSVRKSQIFAHKKLRRMYTLHGMDASNYRGETSDMPIWFTIMFDINAHETQMRVYNARHRPVRPASQQMKTLLMDMHSMAEVLSDRADDSNSTADFIEEDQRWRNFHVSDGAERVCDLCIINNRACFHCNHN